MDLGPGESDSDGMWVYEADGAKHAFVGDAIAKDCHCFFRDGHTTSGWGSWTDWTSSSTKRRNSTSATAWRRPAPRRSNGSAATSRRSCRPWTICAIRPMRPPDPAQEKVIAEMKTYLPTDSTLFLLDYELDYSIGKLLEATAAH